MMQALRQLGGGVIIAIISVVLVLGGISLALAETLPPPSAPTQIPPTLPLTFPTPTLAPGLETPTLPGETPTETATTIPSPTATVFVPTTCTFPAGWIAILTTPNDTIYTLAQRYNTTTDMLSAGNCLSSIDLPAGYLLYVPPVAATATVIPCGPPAGWVKTHIVQPGDNLYRIALSYGITYPQLQVANCMGSSVLIYAGQKLWVPNIPTLTPIPGVTIIPEFPTETPSPTSLPPTETVPPTATVSPTPTSTFMVTATFPTSTPTLTPFPSKTKTP